MLSYTSALYFPKLSYLENVRFGSWGNTTKPGGYCPLYRLDWTKKDQKCEDDHEKWLRQCSPTRDFPLHPCLPDYIDAWLKNQKFAIPHHYMDEIRRNSKRGLEEWGMERSFDTNIREFCLKPAIAHIYTAFYLIADCAYDNAENYFYRGDDKIIIPHALAYRFWAHQTGRGCVRDHAYFSKLEHWAAIDPMVEASMPSFATQAKECRTFLQEMKEHEEKWAKGVEQGMPDTEEDKEAPSLDEKSS